ncbi:MAG TPA: HPF/RaiA family ribosome-associated protein, partial [Nocardioidaceae bacterium]|nr:HPF/RaiA family ribosome-associated protein [Nocardioidaceae bacterium]
MVKSRRCDVSDRFRSHVEEKLTRLEKHDHRVMRV